MVGVEPEFFLLRRDGQGGWTVGDAADLLDKPSYDLKSIHRNQALLDDLRSTLLALGFDLLQIDHEDAIGQYEVNYRFDEALAAADRFILFKLAAHAVAERHGLTFSGMPKPLAHAPGQRAAFSPEHRGRGGTARVGVTRGRNGVERNGSAFCGRSAPPRRRGVRAVRTHGQQLQAAGREPKCIGHDVVTGMEGGG